MDQYDPLDDIPRGSVEHLETEVLSSPKVPEVKTQFETNWLVIRLRNILPGLMILLGLSFIPPS